MVRVRSGEFFFHFGGVQRRVEHRWHVVFVVYVDHHGRFAVLKVVRRGQYQFVLRPMQTFTYTNTCSSVFLFVENDYTQGEGGAGEGAHEMRENITK